MITYSTGRAMIQVAAATARCLSRPNFLILVGETSSPKNVQIAEIGGRKKRKERERERKDHLVLSGSKEEKEEEESLLTF